MNEDLSYIIEQALQSASPLPLTSSDSNLTATTPEPEDEIESLLQEADGASNFEEFCGITESNETDDKVTDNLFSEFSETLCQNLPSDSTWDIELSGQNCFTHSNVGRCNTIGRFDVIDKSIDSPDLTSKLDFESREFVQLEIDETKEHEDSDLSHFSPMMALIEVHPNETSGMISDVRDKTEEVNICKQLEGELSKDSTPPAVSSKTNDIKPKVKRRRRREKNPDPAPPPILPPCSICDVKSSGYHYGANTCEACKGFYRRTLKKKEIDYKCKCTPDEREAWKRCPLKNGCPACRYEKCLAVGMSKNAIKIGRYTLMHKTRNIKEVKTIETIDNFITTFTATVTESRSSSSDLETTTTASNDDFAELFMDHSDQSDTSSPVPVKGQRMATPDAHESSVINLREIDSVVKVLTEAHTTLYIDERINMPTETIRMKQNEYLEKYTIKQEVFGSMGNLTDDEFTDFYNATGMDIDGRIEKIQQGFKYFEDKITMIVDFAKSIPGFTALGLDDQANLIKASRVENSIIGIYKVALKSADPERRVVILPWGATMHVDEIKTFIPVDITCKRQKILRNLLELNLSVQEESVLRAMLIVYSDRCKLDEPQKVDLIQEKLVACLQHLINLRPGASGTLLYKIFNLITNMRDLTEREMDFAKSFLFKWPMLSLSNYNLLKDFITFKVSQ